MSQSFLGLHFKSLWKKFVFLILLVTLLTLLISGFLTMQIEANKINKEMQLDLNTTLKETALSLSDPLWQYNFKTLSLLSNLIINRPNFYRIEIVDATKGPILEKTNPLYLSGTNTTLSQQIPITKNNIIIGSLTIELSKTPYYKELYRRIFNEVIYTLIKTSILISLILWVSYSITKPLKKLEEHIQAFSEGNYHGEAPVEGQDEIAQLTKSFNLMARQIEDANHELLAMNSSLEETVSIRTMELNIANDNLKEALAKSQQVQAELTLKNEDLEKAYKELIEASKGNITSQLISSVAHEINTPVGLLVTALSYMIQETKSFKQAFEDNQLKKSDLSLFIEKSLATSNSMERNLENILNLIHNFKEVAVDQTSLRIRYFNLKNYLEEVIQTLKPSFKHKNLTINLNCDDDINIESYPGAYSQILTNFILNSIKHGFKDTLKGDIKINVKVINHQIVLTYEDNGSGISPENLEHIFTPFFSTEHNQGGSGLGLSIVKHLVEKNLKGEIHCESQVNQWTRFEIFIPQT